MCHANLNRRSREDRFPLKVGTSCTAQPAKKPGIPHIPLNSTYGVPRKYLISSLFSAGELSTQHPELSTAFEMSTFPSQVPDLTFLTLRFQPRQRHPRDPRLTSRLTHFPKNTSVYTTVPRERRSLMGKHSRGGPYREAVRHYRCSDFGKPQKTHSPRTHVGLRQSSR